jgi:hypothetical protein
MSSRDGEIGAGSVMGWGFVGVVVLLALTWAFQGNDFFLYKTFAPKYEQVRRDTFEQSKAYNQGMIQELQNMQFEYVKATPEQKQTLASVILHRAADYNMDDPRVPVDLRQFVQDLRRERTQVR